MYVPLAVGPNKILAPAFTLATALRWLGHHCAQHCSSSLDDLTATIRFAGGNHAHSRATMVVVDFTDSRETVPQTRHLIRDINLCIRSDSIQVLGRRMADIRSALSIVTREPDRLSRCHLQLAVEEPTTKDGDLSHSPAPFPDRAAMRLDGGATASPLPTRLSPFAATEHATTRSMVEMRQP